MEFNYVYFKVAHLGEDGDLHFSSIKIVSIDEMLSRLMDLSLKSYSFIYADYYLNVVSNSLFYLYFVPSEDHSTNIDGSFIEVVSRIRFQST